VAVDAGIPDAKLALAVLFVRGNGVPQNEALAARLFLEAAEAGLDWAQYWIADLYRNGIGVEFDLVRSYAWFNIAAAVGNGPAANARNEIRAQSKLSRDDIERAQDLSLTLMRVKPDQQWEARTRYANPSQKAAKTGGGSAGRGAAAGGTAGPVGVGTTPAGTAGGSAGSSGGRGSGGSRPQRNSGPVRGSSR
jgi:TPR repeat protein